MKYLDGNSYVELKDHRYKIHPTEKIILQKRDQATSLRTQYQVQNKTQIRRNQKVIKNDNDQLVVKNYPKNKQSITQQQNFKLPICPSCKQSIWLEFGKGLYCQDCEHIINKHKHQIDKKVLRQDRDFSTRLNFANKKMKKIWINLLNTNCQSSEDMIIKLQELKGKTKLKIYNIINKYYVNINIRMDEDTFAKNARGISEFYHEFLLLMKFL